MNKHMRLLFAALIIVIIVLAAAITRFYSHTDNNVYEGGSQSAIAKKLDINSGYILFQDSSGMYGLADSSERVVVSPEWESLRFTDSAFLIAEKHSPIGELGAGQSTNPSGTEWSHCYDCSYLSTNEATDEGSIFKSLQTYWVYNSDGSKNSPASLLANGILGPYDNQVSEAHHAPSINSTIGSWHSGGCNIVLGDGSVRFFSSTTAQAILGKYANVDDGMTIESN